MITSKAKSIPQSNCIYNNMKDEYTDLVDFNGILTPQERNRILARINSLLSYIGIPIPREEVIDGEVLELRDIIFNFLDGKVKDEKERETLLRKLENKASEIKSCIESCDISEEEAISLMREVSGILRAIDHLKYLEKNEIPVEKEEILRKIDDERRWREFLKKIRR